MAVFDKGAQQADEKLREVLDPRLGAGETMLLGAQTDRLRRSLPPDVPSGIGQSERAR